MTEKIENFLSLKEPQDEGISFENRKKGYMLGVEKIGIFLDHAIKNIYYNMYIEDLDSVPSSLVSVPKVRVLRYGI